MGTCSSKKSGLNVSQDVTFSVSRSPSADLRSNVNKLSRRSSGVTKYPARTNDAKVSRRSSGANSTSEVGLRVQAYKKSAAHRFGPSMQKEVLLLFHRLKHKQAKDVTIGNKFVGDADYDSLKTMDFKGLREMLPGTDEATLGFIFRFFDANLDGRINTVEFLMAVAMLCHPCDTAQEQLDACFRMFDSDDSGCLSKTEFSEMIRASVALDLGALLLTREGDEKMEVALKKEFAQETIRFWREAVAYRAQPEGDLSAQTAKAIYAQYVRSGAPEEINLPSAQRAAIEAALAAASSEGRPPPADVFVRAEAEMFALMERNAFFNLRSDGQMLEDLADAFFRSADLDEDGTIRFDEYRRWASDQPQVLAFFGQLRSTIVRLVENATTAVASSRTTSKMGIESQAAGAGGDTPRSARLAADEGSEKWMEVAL